MGRGRAQKTTDLIATCRQILTEVQPTTVRGIAYQLFNRKLIPNMGKNATDRVSRVLTIARETGVIPWDWIVDDTRAITVAESWDDPDRYIEEITARYRRDRWAMQPERVFVVSEKATINGVLRPVALGYGVPFAVYHGFSSASAVHLLARISRADRRPLTLLYVGDHDPSGRYMSDEDLPGRIAEYGGRVSIERVAMLERHVADVGDLAFPASAKKTDARYPWFVERFGQDCAEIDALPANELRALVEQAIRRHLDLAAWAQAGSTERAETQSLREFFAAWPGVAS